MCHQLRECLVLCHCLLHLSISFPTRVARGDEPLSGPRAGVESGQPKKFGAMFFKIAFPCLAALTISSGLSLLKRANCTIAITSSSLGYRKLPHETLCSCGWHYSAA